MDFSLSKNERRNFGRVPTSGTMLLGDQADGVRQLAAAHDRHARVLAVTSGKGGVGKTNIAVNLAGAMAQLRKRVVLVDLDLGLANADILLDLEPRYNLSHVFSRQRRIEEVLISAPGGFEIVPGASGVEKLANLDDVERDNLIQAFGALHRARDYIIFDTGAGISKNTTGFLAAADDVLVVTIPEPPAIVDAYAVVKMLSEGRDRGEIYLVVNRASSREEAERIANGFAATAHRFLNVYVSKLGYVPDDPRVSQAVRQKKPFLTAFPNAPASDRVRLIAERLCRSGARAPEERPSFVRRLFAALVSS